MDSEQHSESKTDYSAQSSAPDSRLSLESESKADYSAPSSAPDISLSLESESKTDYSAPSSAPDSGTPAQPPPYYFQGQPTSGYGVTRAVVSQHGVTRVVVGQPMPATYVSPDVNDHMGLAVFACLCCFWPLGLVAISKATDCAVELTRGDVQTAKIKSGEAKTFSLIAIGVGILILIGVIVGIVKNISAQQ